MWDTALKFFFPVLQITSSDHLDINRFFFSTEDGVLYTFGSDYWGCIGCNNELDEDVTLPFRVDFFAEKPVAEVACGECHIVVITGRLCAHVQYTQTEFLISI